MTTIETINILREFGVDCAGLLAASATLVQQARRLCDVLSAPSLPSELSEAIRRLPPGSSAEQIVAALSTLAGLGGSVAVSAGNDGGGSLQLRDVRMSGGDGFTRGGDLRIKAGDGGTLGPGGDITIVGGAFKGGDAKG